jgi:hypothetical protein
MPEMDFLPTFTRQVGKPKIQPLQYLIYPSYLSYLYKGVVVIRVIEGYRGYSRGRE